jgi:hypothetical protein
VPVRLKYLKPRNLLPEPTTLGAQIKKRRLENDSQTSREAFGN